MVVVDAVAAADRAAAAKVVVRAEAVVAVGAKESRVIARADAVRAAASSSRT